MRLELQKCSFLLLKFLSSAAPTIITKQPQDMEILEGGSTVLTCEVMVDADLKVSWKWRHDNRIVKNGIHYYVSAATLTVSFPKKSCLLL